MKKQGKVVEKNKIISATNGKSKDIDKNTIKAGKEIVYINKKPKVKKELKEVINNKENFTPANEQRDVKNTKKHNVAKKKEIVEDAKKRKVAEEVLNVNNVNDDKSDVKLIGKNKTKEKGNGKSVKKVVDAKKPKIIVEKLTTENKINSVDTSLKKNKKNKIVTKTLGAVNLENSKDNQKNSVKKKTKTTKIDKYNKVANKKHVKEKLVINNKKIKSPVKNLDKSMTNSPTKPIVDKKKKNKTVKDKPEGNTKNQSTNNVETDVKSATKHKRNNNKTDKTEISIIQPENSNKITTIKPTRKNKKLVQLKAVKNKLKKKNLETKILLPQQKRKNLLSIQDVDLKNYKNQFETPDDELSSSSSCEDLFEAIRKSKKLKLSECQIYEPNLPVKRKNEMVEDESNKKKIKTIPQTYNPSISTEAKVELASNLDRTDNKSTKNNDTEMITPDEKSKIKSKKIIDQNTGSVQYHITSSCCIFILKHPCKLYFHGKLILSVISGTIDIFGYRLGPQDTKKHVYSPKGFGHLYIETIDPKRNKTLDVTLQKLNLSKEIIKEITTSNEEICVLALQKLENKFTRSIETYFTESFFPKFYQGRERCYFSPAELKLQTYFEEEPKNWSVFEVGDDWPSVVNEIQENVETRLMVCGGKGVGKSTFTKYVINKLLNNYDKVLLIDLDPGQTEFTISGTLSATLVDSPIFGPNYTQLRKPIRCDFIGEVNITHCFGQYLAAIKDLMLYCEQNIDNKIPWIVNYMGYSKSLGSDLILSVIQLVNPTMLVQINSSNKKLNFSRSLQLSSVKTDIQNDLIDSTHEKINYELRVIQAVFNKKGPPPITPKTLREASIISYFSEVLMSNDYTKKSLQTYCISLSSIKISHVSGNEDNLLAVSNGNIVALCSNSTNVCLGFGIVRGVDNVTNKLYLITPEKGDTMKTVNNLVMGFIMMPTSFYLKIECTDITPYVSVKIKQKTATIPKRMYMSYKDLFKKNYK